MPAPYRRVSLLPLLRVWFPLADDVCSGGGGDRSLAAVSTPAVRGVLRERSLGGLG